MGTMAPKIIGMDAKELIDMLNKALADEWLAYYQYWVGSLVVRGPMRPDVEKELKEHAKEELEHAEMLANRIIQLGGKPILHPKEWFEKSNCGYDEPKDENVIKILQQNVKGERCAIGVYNKMLQKIKGDYVTFNMLRKILEDELEHEEDLENLLEDLKIK